MGRVVDILVGIEVGGGPAALFGEGLARRRRKEARVLREVWEEMVSKEMLEEGRSEIGTTTGAGCIRE